MSFYKKFRIMAETRGGACIADAPWVRAEGGNLVCRSEQTTNNEIEVKIPRNISRFR